LGQLRSNPSTSDSIRRRVKFLVFPFRNRALASTRLAGSADYDARLLFLTCYPYLPFQTFAERRGSCK